MLRIISHIEQLLQVHDCVIVPGIGGFVSQVIPTVYDAEKHLFIPMHREVVFNGSLHHNDGLLTESYMKAYEVGFNEAFRMVETDVTELKTALREAPVRLGVIGKLVLSDNACLVFESGDHLYIPEVYGLSLLQMKTLQALQKEELALLTEERKSDTIYIPIRKKVLHGIAVTAAAVALLFFSTPVKDVDKNAYKTTVFPFEITAAIQPKQQEPDVVELVVQTAEETPELLPVEEVIQPVSQPVVTNKKMYHIIIGSFVTNKQADDFIEKVDHSICPQVDRIIRDERIRVYANKFDNREEAETYLETLRQHPNYQDAWLFISR